MECVEFEDMTPEQKQAYRQGHQDGWNDAMEMIAKVAEERQKVHDDLVRL
jgi:hypothetical protein